MGIEILDFYKKKIKREYKLAFIMASLLTIVIHAYKFFNYIPNADSIYNYYFHQDVIQLGRWALGFFCSISSFFDLPWVIGLLSSVYIGLTTVTIVALFKVKNPIVIGIIAGLLSSSPCTIDTFHYLYTADGYMFGMLLSALAVYLSRIEEKRLRFKFISIILLCISCAIYQSNINFALLLSLCSLFKILLDGKYEKKECINWIFNKILIYIISLGLYYIVWQILLKIRNILPYDYLGISKIGEFSFDYIKEGIIKCFQIFCKFFFMWDIGEYGIVQYSVYSILFLISLIAIFVFAIIKKKLYKRLWAFWIFVLATILIIPLSNFWCFVSLELVPSNYLPRMLQCLTVLYVFATILYEEYASKKFKNLFGILMILIIFYNFIIANISYSYMKITFEKTYADASEMINRINEITSNNETVITEIVFVGNRLDGNFYTYVDEENRLNQLSKYNIVFSSLHKILTFDPQLTYLFLKVNFDLPYTSRVWEQDYLDSYYEKEEIKNMPAWPDKDSIMIFEGKLILKLSN